MTPDELVKQINDEIKNLPTSFDFATYFTGSNAKFYNAPYLGIKQTIEIKDKNIGSVNLILPKNGLSFNFINCVITNAQLQHNKVTFKECTITNLIAFEDGSGATFDKGTITEFKLQNNSTLHNYYFNGTTIGQFKIPFHNTKFYNITFNSVTFNNISDFKEIVFGSNITFLNCKFKLLGEDRSESEFRHLKKVASEIKNETLVNLFSALEVKSRYLKLEFKSSFYEKTFGTLNFLINDFGLKQYLPLVYLVLISVLILGLNFSESGLHNALVFLFTPLKIFNKELFYQKFFVNPVIDIFIQIGLNLLGAILWFFFILGLRKTFKVDR